jgi:hypothetical protein
MARPLSSSQKSKWRKFGNFSVMAVLAPTTGTANLNFEVAGFSGTLKGLAAISSSAGTTVQDKTAGVDLYTMSSANTPYTGTPENPLFSYNYTAFNKIGLSAPISAFAGIIGTIPDGFNVAVACLRSAAIQSVIVASGPATLKYFKLIFCPTGAIQHVTVTAGPNDIKKLTTNSGGDGEMEFMHLGPGGPQIASGQNLTISFDSATGTHLVGIFLLEV